MITNVSDSSEFRVYKLGEDSLTTHLTVRYVQVPDSTSTITVHPASFRTDVDGTVHPVWPAWYNQLQRVKLENGDVQSLITALSKEIVIQGQPVAHSLALRGRIVVSNALPRGTFSFTRDYIIVNESQHPAWDADGDLLNMLFYTDAEGYRRAVDTVNPITGVRGRRSLSTSVWKFHRGQMCPGLKWPTTMSLTQTSILQYVPFTDIPHEVPYDLTRTELDAQLALCKPQRETRRDLFIRAYSSVPVGLAYNGEWTRELWDSEGLPLHERQDQFLTPRVPAGAEPGTPPTTTLYDIIESDMLKRVRANDGGAAEAAYVGPGISLFPEYAMYTVSTNGIGRKSLSQLSWLQEIPDLRKHLADVATLNLGYYVPEPVERTVRPRWTYPSGLIRRLRACKLLRATPIPHPAGVPAYIITLHNERGEVCGLRGIQQGEKVFGMSWSFIILPVLDVLHGKYMDPLEHMDECSRLVVEKRQDPETGEEFEVPVAHSNGIMGVDDRIQNPTTGETVRRLFESVYNRELARDRGGAKDASFYWRAKDVVRFLTAYAGKYGVMVQSEKQGADQVNVPRKFVLNMAQGAVIVDFGFPVEDPEEAFELFELAQQKAGLRLVPTAKGTDPQVRKHAVAHADDDRYPAYAKRGPKLNTNPRRSSQLLSQLLQSSTPPVRLNVALTLSAPQLTPVAHNHALNQVKITSRGIDKMRADVFNPRVSATRPDTGCCAILEGRDWVAYWNDEPTKFATFDAARSYLRERVKEEELGVVPTYWARTVDSAFDGTQSLVWIESGRPTSSIGKLVDPYGSKFVPMYFPETIASFEDGTMAQVDLLYPVHEAMAKNLLELFVDNAKPVLCRTSSGEEFLGYFAQLQFVRTGAASENTDVRVDEVEVGGVAAHLVSSAMRACGFPDSEVHVPRLEYVCALHELLVHYAQGLHMFEDEDLYADYDTSAV